MAFERLEGELSLLLELQRFINFSTDDIAIHTWTHPYMTTLSNLEIVAELGWTMAIIHDSTGGRIPAYWRPPFGDSDNRVNAIAKEVFGLTTVMWNREWVFGSMNIFQCILSSVFVARRIGDCHQDWLLCPRSREAWTNGWRAPSPLVLWYSNTKWMMTPSKPSLTSIQASMRMVGKSSAWLVLIIQIHSRLHLITHSTRISTITRTKSTRIHLHQSHFNP